MSFVSDRRFPSLLREIKGGVQKKEQFCCEKREQKFFFAERNSRRVSRPPLSCRLRDSLRRETSLHTHTKVASLCTPKTDKTHLYGEQEESDRTRVSRDHQ
jgi:hypothetical protein